MLLPQIDQRDGAWLWRLEALDRAPTDNPVRLVSLQAVDVYERSAAPTVFDNVLGSAGSHARRAIHPPTDLTAPQQAFLHAIRRLSGDSDLFHGVLRGPLGAAYEPLAGEALRERTLVGDAIWLAKPDLLEGPYAGSGQALLAPGTVEVDLANNLEHEPARLASLRLAALDVFESASPSVGTPDPSAEVAELFGQLREFLKSFSLRVVTRQLGVKQG